MTRSLRWLVSLVCCLLLGGVLPSCKESADAPDEITLELSNTELTFSREGTEQTLTVQTNAPRWSAFSTQEGSCVSLVIEGSTLRVKVAENTLGQARTAVVIVNASGEQRRVNITQTAAELVFDLHTTSVMLGSQGGEETIAYTANAPGAKAELSEPNDWLTISRSTDRDFTITAKPNTDKHKRSAKILVTLGSTIREVAVEQDGDTPYLFPLLRFPARLAEVIAYERSRGCELAKTPTDFADGVYRFATPRKDVPFMQYEFAKIGDAGFFEALTASYDASLYVNNPDFDAFLKESGFVETENEDADERQKFYKNTKAPILLRLSIAPDGVVLRFFYTPEQPADQATFTAMPGVEQRPFLSFVADEILGKTHQEMLEYEKGLGSEIRDDLQSQEYELFKVKKSFSGEIYRGYFFLPDNEDTPEEYRDHLTGVQYMYSGLSQAYFQDLLGRYQPTKECLAFFAKNNYPHLTTFTDSQTNKTKEAFYNEDEKLAYVISYSGIDGKAITAIQHFYTEFNDDEGGSGSVARLANTRKYFQHRQQIIQRVKAQMTRLRAPRR